MGVLGYVDNGKASFEQLRYALNKEMKSLETVVQTDANNINFSIKDSIFSSPHIKIYNLNIFNGYN